MSQVDAIEVAAVLGFQQPVRVDFAAVRWLVSLYDAYTSLAAKHKLPIVHSTYQCVIFYCADIRNGWFPPTQSQLSMDKWKSRKFMGVGYNRGIV